MSLVKAAGVILYRRGENKTKEAVQFLLLKASYGNYHWSPPKGSHSDGLQLFKCK